MAIEEQKTGYYDSLITSKNYVDSRLSAKVATFNYLDRAFFGEDVSRLVYAEPQYAFRSRLESLAKGIDGENIFVNNLDLPFGSFWVTNPPEIIKSASCSEMLGLYSKELEYYVHFFEVKHKMKAILWFTNFNECEAAYTVALAESHSGNPYRFINNVYWRGKGLGLPNYVYIRKVSMGNQSTTFDKFLSSNHLHSVILDIEVETPQLHINRGINLIQLPIKWASKPYADDWKDGDKEYFTQKCVLEFAHEKWNAFPIPPKLEQAPVIEANVSLLAREQLHDLDDETANAIASVIPNRNITEMVEAAFSNKALVRVAKLGFNKEKTTISDKGEVTAYIDFQVHRSTYQYWKKCTVVIPSHPNIDIENCKQVDFQIPGLHPNSEYTIHILAEDIGGTIDDIPLTFVTPKWEKETLAEADTTVESLNNRLNDDPEKVPLNSLIGLDDDWTGLDL